MFVVEALLLTFGHKCGYYEFCTFSFFFFSFYYSAKKNTEDAHTVIIHAIDFMEDVVPIVLINFWDAQGVHFLPTPLKKIFFSDSKSSR